MWQHRAAASDLPFHDILVPTEHSSFEVSDDIIAYDLWFGSPQAKILATPMVAPAVILFRYDFKRCVVVLLFSSIFKI